MDRDVMAALRERGIRPSAQRIAVGEYVLRAHDHPSAEQVFARVRRRLPVLSRATVYNTLNLFVRKGLLQSLVLAEGRVVFDPHVERHHHFIDERSGSIHDVPWRALAVSGVHALEEFEVKQYQVVMRGRRRASSPEHG